MAFGIARRAPLAWPVPGIRARRLARCLSQAEVADRAQVTRQTVMRAERTGVARFATARKLAAALAVTPDDLRSVAPVETAEATA